MSYTTTIQEFLASIYPFDQLSSTARLKLSNQCQLLRYRMGQAIVVREKMPAHVAILFQGQARLLGYDPRNNSPVTLKLLQPGEILGWVGLVRGVPCETAIASTESVCLILNTSDFFALLEQEKVVSTALRSRCALSEVFELLGAELEHRAHTEGNLKELAQEAWLNGITYNLQAGKPMSSQLEPNRVWFVSGGARAIQPVGTCLDFETVAQLSVTGSGATRLVGIPASLLAPSQTINESVAPVEAVEIPYAPTQLEDNSASYLDNQRTTPKKYPFFAGKGAVEGTLACFQMLSQHLNIPFRRDTLRRVLVNQQSRSGNLSLQNCGAIAEMSGLSAQLVNVPAVAVSRLPTPAMLYWQGCCAILYETSDRLLVLAAPEIGIQR
ncbi:MAG: cyclic nucleotide-binding domain-containing protein, partial [Coleofasciculaceae cyanobacterium]